MEIFSLLLFDVLLDEFVGDGTTGDSAVASCPEVSSPEDFCKVGAILEKRMSALSFDVLHHVTDGELGWIGDEKVDVIRSDLPREDANVDLGTESSYEGTHGLPQFTCEHSFPVLGYPDEMHLQIVLGVTAGVIRPRHGSHCRTAHLGSEGPPKGVGLYLPPL